MNYDRSLVDAIAYKGLNLICLYVSAILYTFASFIGFIKAGASDE